MPVFTTAAAAIVGTTALTGLGASIATSVIASGLAYGTGHLLGVFDAPGGGSIADEGVDVRLAPNTQNRLPILLGAFQQRGIAVYYEVSEDRQNLHTVVALGEGPITSIDEIYWEDLLLTLDANGVVTDATDRDGVSVDRLNGLVTVQTYLGTSTGNNSTYLEGLSELWTENHKMTNIAYAVVSVQYDRESEVTGLGDMRFIGTGVNDNPSDVVKDLLENPRYGLNLDSGLIDTASFTAAAGYYDEMITYEDTDGVDQMQKRHRVNGVLNTGDTVLQRIETVLNGCNSSLRWSNGRWGVFVNKEETATTFEFDDKNIIGNVSIVETGLNNLFNRIEVQYGRNEANNWQRATAYVESPASVRYPNELDRTMSLNLPLVSTSVEAKAAATVILNQGRQQLTVKHNADATAMPLEAGDVVSYTKSELGWSGKLFRIVEVTEMESRGALEYSITAVEYADAVYDYGVLNEDDVAPNVPVVDVAAIEAVDDLSITGTFRAAATPYIGLTWTVPDNSLIESFTIFYNTVNETFNSGNTKLGGIERIPVGNYTAGDTVSHQLVGVPAGDVSIWVVGTNSFVSSSESNRVEVINWDPVVMIGGDFEIGTRYNETPSVINGVDIDVGAPPANATGTGTGRNNDTNDTGWYIFDPEATDRENAPVWTATAEVERTGAEPRLIDFTFSGTAATQTTTFTPETQETDFTFSGNVGEREFFYNARPQITDFTLSGQSADFDAGVGAQWGIKVSGSTDATGPDTNDVFYIAPAGTSNTFTGESFTFTPNGDTSDGMAPENTDASAAGTIPYSSNSTPGWRTRADGGAFISALDNSSLVSDIVLTRGSAEYSAIISFFNVTGSYTDLPSGTVLNFTNSDGAVFRVTDPMEIRSFSAGSLQIQRQDQAAFTDFTVTPESGNSAITSADTAFTLDFNSVGATVSSSVSITLDSDTNSYTLADNLSGGAAVGAALNTAIGTDYDADWVKTFDATTGAITFTADDSDDHSGSVSVVAGSNGTLTVAPTNAAVVGTATTIRLQVTTESIDETIAAGSNLTGTALITSIFNEFSDITAITDEFTVEQVLIDIDGTSTEVVRFTANDFVDHVFMVSVNSGIDGTTSGTVTDGQAAGNATTIRVSYDDSIIPSFQDITFSAGNNVDAAGELTALIDGHGGLSASHANYVFGSNVGPSPVYDVDDNITEDFSTVAIGSINQVRTNVFSLVWPGASNSNFVSINVARDTDFTSLRTAETITTNYNGSAVSVGDFIGVGYRYKGQDDDVDDGTARVMLKRVTSVSGGTFGVEATGTEFPNFSDVSGAGSLTTDGFVSWGYSRFVIFYGSDILDVYDPADIIDVLEPDVEGNAVLITNDADGVVDAAITTVTTQGTGDAAFQDIEVREGVTSSGTASSYVITHAGLQVAGGNFSPASSAGSMATQLTTAINSTSVIAGSTFSNVSTATSVANSASTTSVAITGGTNKPGGTSTNDAASVGAVSQVGSAIDAFGGVDSVVNVFNGGELYYTQSYNGGTREDLVADVVDGINFDNPLFSNFFTAGVQADDTDEIVATSDFVGTTPILTMSVVPGFTATVDSVGNITQTAATLGIARTVVSDGQSDPVISGTLSTYTVSQGGTEVISATNLSSGLSSSAVTMAISSAVAASADIDYTTGVDGPVLTTTSTFNDSTPDLVITVTPGTNADATLGDLQVVKVVTQDGDPGTLDFTDAVWTYAITAPTTDGDTTMIGTDGTIQVRRGLVLDTTAAEEISGVTETEVLFVDDADTHTTGSRPSTLVIQGSVSMPALTVATAGAALGFIFEQSTDYDPDSPADATWTAIQTSIQVGLTAATAYVGQVVNVALPIATTFDADASTKYFFRARRNGVSENTDLASGIAAGFLIIEELRT